MKVNLHKMSLFLGVFLTAGMSQINAQTLNLDWTAPILGSGNANMASSITLGEEGYVYAVGGFRDSIEVNTTSGPVKLFSKGEKSSPNLFVSKIDPMGNIVWIKAFGGKGSMGAGGGNDANMTYYFSVTSDGDDNLYISGNMRDTVDFSPGTPGALKASLSYLSSSGGGSIGSPPTITKNFYENSFILKLNRDGEFVWARTLYGNGNAAGNIAIDHNDGAIAITGYFKDTVDFNDQKGTDVLTTFKGGQNTYVAKYDTSGNFIWAKAMGRTNKSTSYDQGIDIYIDDHGYVYAVGVHADSADYDPGAGTAYLYSSSSPGYNTFVLKLDPAGNYVWAGSIGSIRANLSSRGSGIAVDSKGGVYTTGWFSREGNFDPEKNPIYNVVGNTSTYGNAFISKLDSNGRYAWAKTFNRPPGVPQAYDNGLSVQTDEENNVYFTGYFAGKIYFDPDSTNNCRELFETNQGNSASDLFAVKLNEDGDFIWGKQLKTENPPPLISTASVGKSIKISGESVYLAGGFSGNTDFNYKNTPHVINSLSPKNALGYDGFVAKYTYDISGAELVVETCGDEYEIFGKTYFTSGRYIQKARNNAGCDSIFYLNLTLNPMPDPVINVDGFVLGISPSYPNSTSFQWIYNEEEIPGATDSTYTVTKNGFYRVVVTTDKGCTDTSDVYEVTNVPSNVENILQPEKQIRIYPNPVNNNIYIQSEADVNVILYHIDGREVKSVNNTKEIAVGELAEGTYILKIFDKEGKVLKVEKVVKTR